MTPVLCLPICQEWKEDMEVPRPRQHQAMGEGCEGQLLRVRVSGWMGWGQIRNEEKRTGEMEGTELR